MKSTCLQRKNIFMFYHLEKDSDRGMSVFTCYATIQAFWEELDHHSLLSWKDLADGMLYWKQIEERTHKFLASLNNRFKGDSGFWPKRRYPRSSVFLDEE